MKPHWKKRKQTQLGQMIRKVREEHGLNQYEFADVIGTTQSTVSNWETGRITHIRSCFYEPLKEFFGVDMERWYKHET